MKKSNLLDYRIFFSNVPESPQPQDSMIHISFMQLIHLPLFTLIMMNVNWELKLTILIE